MAIRVVCPQCAKVLQAPDAAAGKRARCSGCQAVLTVPAPAAKPSVEQDEYRIADAASTASPKAASAAPGAPRPATHVITAVHRSEAPAGLSMTSVSGAIQSGSPPAERVSAAKLNPNVKEQPSTHRVRNYLYLVFALALVPLAWSTFGASDDTAARIRHTLESNAQVFEQAESTEMDMATLFSKLPGGRFEGAHLAHSTWMHWLYGLISAAAFLGLIMLAFEQGQVSPKNIALVGLGTATVGIVFLLAVQFLAELSQGIWVRGTGIITIIFYIIKLIGFSYHAADDPENGFLLSFLGFTIGVGLCEEFTKALPVIIRSRDERAFTWRAAVMWGLASGVGFGVAEGIMYSSRYYNGIHTGEIYVIRFVSCVALHAVWSAAVALLIWHNRDKIVDATGWADFALAVLMVQGVPMVLHGLYDTMLKKDMQVWALGTAVVSFVWLAILVEYTRRQQETPAEPRPRFVATGSG